MMSTSPLQHEWERIETLCACVTTSRRGGLLSEEMKNRLSQLQYRVGEGRRLAPWEPFSSRRELGTLDCDILACALAPEADPRLGWLYRELQPGVVSTHPTPALIWELLFMTTVDRDRFSSRFDRQAPLLKSGAIVSDAADRFHPVHPGRTAIEQLIGKSPAPQSPPGTVEATVRGGMDDLVLPHNCKELIREFLLWSTHRETVVNQWGAQVDGGPVALFSGPSGTGKTFAAGVIANSLGRPLFRVDLGILVSKYIGETEKNLNALFDAAAGQELVLLFDEADSLFGKRGEVRDARDRYANMEVSHLLSRIEQHQGPCILTTNLRRHLDAAFARRFQMVIEFPRPDRAARDELWRKSLPPRAPLASEVRTELLADQLNLTGGQIRNIANHAAFLAAGEGADLGLTHLARSARTELAKQGRELLDSSLGRLAPYLNAKRIEDVDDR